MPTSKPPGGAVPALREPTFTERYALGSKMNRHMDHFCTLEELATELGVTKQNAHTEAVLALGKLAYHLRARLGLRHTPWPR